ncbi:MAG: hypothetical protein GWP62_08435 [Gammaproteobacteria bacterium]|jgi:hypothetical protein|nr:hypothetical protein [Gammaproteobacteria bacterium]
MLIRGLPLIACLAPLIGINLAYWIGADHDVLPSCIPYLDGCTSISSTGRYPPGDRLFRAVMLPQAAVLAFTWYFAALWLKALKPDSKAGKAVLVSGIAGALALVVYVSYLASNDPFYEFMRRYGIYFYFVGTALAQLVLSLALDRSPVQRAMVWVIVTPFALGIINLVQKAILGSENNNENRIEWIASLLMQVWFVLLWVAWRKSRFNVRVQAG